MTFTCMAKLIKAMKSKRGMELWPQLVSYLALDEGGYSDLSPRRNCRIGRVGV
jgi:hypothetical protein